MYVIVTCLSIYALQVTFSTLLKMFHGFILNPPVRFHRLAHCIPK